jgi:hypothetical protein
MHLLCVDISLKAWKPSIVKGPLPKPDWMLGQVLTETVISADFTIDY